MSPKVSARPGLVGKNFLPGPTSCHFSIFLRALTKSKNADFSFFFFLFSTLLGICIKGSGILATFWCLGAWAVGSSWDPRGCLADAVALTEASWKKWIEREPTGPPRKMCKKKKTFFYFSGPQKSLAQNGPKWGQKDFFILIQTLPTFWATRILILRIFIFWICLAPPWGGPQVGARVGPRVNAGAEIQQVPKDKISRMKILFCHLNTDRQETRASNQGPRTKSWTKISTLVPFYLYPK